MQADSALLSRNIWSNGPQLLGWRHEVIHGGGGIAIFNPPSFGHFLVGVSLLLGQLARYGGIIFTTI